MVIGIIGAGASGMAAALAAAENPGVRVILFERQARVGRKLQATGNGRCNLTNLNADQTGYHGLDPEFSACAINAFPPVKTLAWFRELGLYTVAEASGRVYPYSDQANSVVDVLRFGLNQDNIDLMTGFEVKKISKKPDGFYVEGDESTVRCDKLIVACGGLAGTKLGGSMSGYKLLRSMGHSCSRLRPALVQLKSNWSALASLKGVRANCRASIVHNGSVFSQSSGEVQFTEYGLSGPVIFEVSRDVCQEKGNWTCRLDLIPEMDADALTQELLRRRRTRLTADELLTGILHNRLGRVLVQTAALRLQTPIAQLTDAEITSVCALVKGLEVVLTEPMGVDSAQVTAGGITTAEFDPATLESRLVSGLYACGEVLDVDGDCGGYNLQWAWSSGRLAGLQAGGKQL